jgi:hypothetical protein
MKLQPVFSWQKYEGTEESQKEQFQYQLQTQFTQVSNAVNTTIDDESYFLTERQTSFTWVQTQGSRPPQLIWKVTVPVVWNIGGLLSTNALPVKLALGQTITVVDMTCTLVNGTTAIPVPYVDTTALANQINLSVVGTDAVLVAGVDRSAWAGYVTVYYTKSR